MASLKIMSFPEHDVNEKTTNYTLVVNGLRYSLTESDDEIPVMDIIHLCFVSL